MKIHIFSGIAERVHAPGQPGAAAGGREGGCAAGGRLLPHLAGRGRRAHRQDAPRRPLHETPLAAGAAEEGDGRRHTERQDRTQTLLEMFPGWKMVEGVVQMDFTTEVCDLTRGIIPSAIRCEIHLDQTL